MSQASDQITEYLSVGGLFNPEFMNQTQHEAVRNTLIKARDDIQKLERENAALKQRIIDDNKAYGCEIRDPSGTIWEYAHKLQKENAELRDSQCTTWHLEKLLTENTALKEKLSREIHADTTRLEWLLSHKGRTWFCRSIENGDWIASIGDARGFIDMVRKLQA